MKIAVIGATGFVGTQVVNEALNRGYEVTALARNVEKLAERPNLTAKTVDVNNVDELAGLLAGHDAVVNTFNAGWGNPNIYDDFIKGSKDIQQAVKQSGVKRLLVVGGAGSLYIDGKQLVDSPEFPAQWLHGAQAARDYLNIIKEETELDWTFLSPAIMLHPGERTGAYRTGTESPVFNADGKCEISVEDMAVAILDELEKNQFVQKRFTVAY